MVDPEQVLLVKMCSDSVARGWKAYSIRILKGRSLLYSL